MTKVIINDAVYNDAYLPHLANHARTQIFYGGSSSGKSVFLAERCIEDVLKGGRNYLICRQVARTIKTSVFAQVCRIISEWGVASLFAINKSDYLITCIPNGYQISFVGLDDVEKIKSIVPAKGAWTDIWCEEATEMERSAVRQLYKRQRGGSNDTPKRLTLSFNPIIQQHWIYEDFFSKIGWSDKQTEYKADDGTLSIFKTTYKDNRFLTADDRKDLENETDSYFYNVYTLGNWGVLGNVIFTNWRVEDLSDMHDQFTNRRHGLDFGFSGDPAAMPNTHYDRMRKIIYIYNELYEKDLTNPELAARIAPMLDDDLITCDSAEPKSIRELQDNGINAYPAKKGKDSVLFGIQWLRQQTIVIDKKCINMQREAQTYKWKEDANGNALPIPVDKFNHLWDGLRYAYEDDMQESGGMAQGTNPLADYRG